MDADGVWICQECNRPSLRSCTLLDPPTCGQRDTMYCPLCLVSRTFQFSEMVRDAEHLKWILDRQRRSGVADATRAGAFIAESKNVVFEGDAPRALQGVLPKPNDFTFATAISAGLSGEVSDLPLHVDNDTIAKYIAAHHATEGRLRDLKAYLQNIVLPEIERAQRDISLCKICLERPKAVIVLPCKHRCMCQPCTQVLMEKINPLPPPCPICREPIRDFIVPFE